MHYYLYVITVCRLFFFKVNPNCDAYSFIFTFYLQNYVPVTTLLSFLSINLT